jgi:23S rRNA pseudouridine1911/1915/1917 synthase
MNLKYNVEKSMSINQILSEKFQVSTRLKNKLIKNKCILLNSYFEDTRTIANNGDIITVILDSAEDNSNIVPTKMDLNIVYEDDHLLVINKPAGIAIHPSILHFDDSISNGIKYYFDSIGLHKKIRPVNRIDLNTSGLVLFAKNEYIQECLIKQMTSGLFTKTYICIVDGVLDDEKRNYRCANR